MNRFNSMVALGLTQLIKVRLIKGLMIRDSHWTTTEPTKHSIFDTLCHEKNHQKESTNSVTKNCKFRPNQEPKSATNTAQTEIWLAGEFNIFIFFLQIPTERVDSWKNLCWTAIEPYCTKCSTKSIRILRNLKWLNNEVQLKEHRMIRHLLTLIDFIWKWECTVQELRRE